MVAKLIATWQLSRMRGRDGIPGGPLGAEHDLDGDVAALRTSSSTSRDSSATRALWALTSGTGALALMEEGVRLIDHDHDQRPGRRRPQVPGVGDAQDRAMAGLAVDHQPMHPPQHVADLAQVILGR